MSNRKFPIVGECVIINSRGHLKDGRTGVVIYHSEFMGTVGIEVDGQDYGFMLSEVSPRGDAS